MMYVRKRGVGLSYFAENYSKLRFPLAHGDAPGFRDAQRGALFAVGAHFSRLSEPAIVTMPTGSGKTAVLQASALLLRATRVLVLTPSRLVREQIAEDFKTLGVLKRLGAVPDDIELPRVMTAAKRVIDADSWSEMRDFDVVVATVPSVSPNLNEVAAPPADLFDVVLVDEAHHSPAITWAMTLGFFPEAKKVLFTATPFRRDDREIKGRFVYTYDLKSAYRDHVFGHIEYQPVDLLPLSENDENDEDIAIARAAEKKFQADRSAGFTHLLMVRTDSRARAAALEKIYAEKTGLKLKLVHGGQSLGHVKKVLTRLSENDLDGVICVNMLGEGFDMPRLKIAAVHAPHRSLAVTLQFIGRFARTAGENLGQATFIASRSSVKVEAEKLYAAGAVWAEIIPNLSEARVQRELALRETLESFDSEASTIAALSDLSLYTLSPYAHVKIFRLREEFDIRTTPSFGFDREQVFGRISESTNSSIYVTRKTTKVPWSTDDRLTDVRFDLFVLYYDASAKLLFVCASKRSDGLYRRIVRDLVGYDPKILGLSSLNRALKELQNARFYNVGMRNRQQSSLTESYRMITGSRADEAIRPEDSRLFHRGHCFGSAVENGIDVTIGLSSASKIWSNTSLSLLELLTWCQSLARKIEDNGAAVTGSKLDLLAMGEPVAQIPSRILFAEWDKDIYIDPPMANYAFGEKNKSVSLPEFDLVVESSNERGALLRLEGHGLQTKIVFSLDQDAHFSYASGDDPTVELSWGRNSEDLTDYLNDNPLHLMLDDWSRLCGEEHFASPRGDVIPFDASRIKAIDWIAEGIDINLEFAKDAAQPTSIQGYLTRALNVAEHDVVYWDHGSGETADFVTIARTTDGGVGVTFYHCKGSSGSAAGNRVDDVYEVCGQAVKGIIWCDLERLIERLSARFARGTGMAQFIRGDEAAMRALSSARPVRFEMVIVQPGISQKDLEQKLGEVLAAADAHLVRAGHSELGVWANF
ncbi:DEAD/DEAH box helicase [Methylobacterium soli]|uniref:DEAD/DEAH box helicase n=1 Tax=Methylobacterium soli TaxID=553447 RepID=A0A6L3SYM0_9HYPH|nr:DEAD/DEAH box helicase family protein [Methylobacterium soli]KAB1078367.1 DEAD/DEAH box helicase [Methylobacterium soli]GJE41131.1 hypothetical protein AEGHOMDF_0291 [Methylobacterium soli]